MSKEIIFRSAVFGGFKREDVIKYIEQLQTEIVDDKRIIGEKVRALKDAEDKIASLEAEIEKLKASKPKKSETKKTETETKKKSTKKRTTKKEKAES
ncbi:MAG: hypothetical protein IJM97_02445 [Clostridia bacterium]|nr:hypothetical protein [Clostridia bacterium]